MVRCAIWTNASAQCVHAFLTTEIVDIQHFERLYRTRLTRVSCDQASNVFGIIPSMMTRGGIELRYPPPVLTSLVLSRYAIVDVMKTGFLVSLSDDHRK